MVMSLLFWNRSNIVQVSDRITRFWIIVASKDHVRTAVANGIAQACHGQNMPIKRMKKGDLIIYYSGKQTMGQSKKCQEFTALGKVSDDEVYEIKVSEDFCPSRRNIKFVECKDTPIISLIDNLDFIQNKKSWGYPFRYGFLEIGQHDFKLISTQMLSKDHV